MSRHAKKRRQAKKRAANPAPIVSPKAPLPQAPAEPPAVDRLPHWTVLLGATLLVLTLAASPQGPHRSPNAFLVVRTLAALAGALTLAIFGVGRPARPLLPFVAAALATLTLAAALGVAPELIALPLHGLGERMWGFPTLLPLPLAGALMFTATRRGAALAAALGILTLAGLLQPTDLTGDLHLALIHLIRHAASFDRAAALILAAAAIALPLTAATAPTGRLARVTGAAALLILPAWSLLRLISAPGAAPLTALSLTTGASLLLAAAAPALLRPRPPRARVIPHLLEATALLGLVVVWLLLKSFTWRWSTTDENIYFYAADQLKNGVLPYRDFFFAHPPMHLVVPALLFKLFGFSIGLAKAIPVAATLITAAALWLMQRSTVGRLAAFLTAASFLFAFEILQASTNMNGVNLTAMWLTLGLLFLWRDRPALSGIALGLAVTTGFYAIAGALALLALAFFKSPAKALRQTVAFVLVAGGINLVFYTLAPHAYVQSVYEFHLLKAARDKAPALIKVLYYQTPLFWGWLLAPGVAAWQLWRRAPHPGEPLRPEASGWFFSPSRIFREPGIGLVKTAWLLALALFVEFMRFKEIYDFYFILLFPAAAICTGFTLSGIAGAILHECRQATLGRLRPVSLGALALLIAWGGYLPLAREANWVFASKRGKGPYSEWLNRGTRRSYRWVEPAALASLSGPIVRALFWRDHRTRGHMAPSYQHFLWQKSLHLSVAQEVADYVRAHSQPNETIAGSSLVAPAIALLSDRRIADQQIDTNGKRFKAGLYTLPAFFEDICDDNIRFLVTAPSGFISTRLAMRIPAVRRYFKPVQSFPDPWNKFLHPGRRVWAVTLWQLKDPPQGQPRCGWITPSARPNRRRP